MWCVCFALKKTPFPSVYRSYALLDGVNVWMGNSLWVTPCCTLDRRTYASRPLVRMWTEFQSISSWLRRGFSPGTWLSPSLSKLTNSVRVYIYIRVVDLHPFETSSLWGPHYIGCAGFIGRSFIVFVWQMTEIDSSYSLRDKDRHTDLFIFCSTFLSLKGRTQNSRHKKTSSFLQEGLPTITARRVRVAKSLAESHACAKGW